MQIHKKY